MALESGGLFARLFYLMDSSPAFPDWVKRYMELEILATSISGYAPMVVPGLLQTEDYARAVLRAGRPRDWAEQVEARVQARLQRQGLLFRKTPPACWFVLEQELFKRPVGGPKIMSDQLRHLAEKCDDPSLVIQVLPTGVGAHAALGGTLTLLALSDKPGVAYIEGPFSGQLFEEPTTDRLDLGAATWRKSSYSNGQGGECIEVADGFPGVVPVRDSKAPEGAALAIPVTAWQAFVRSL